MIQKTTQWPHGSGAFPVSKVLVMTSGPDAPTRCGADTIVVSTPLDLIRILEDQSTCVARVLLAGKFARDYQLRSFLLETYPRVDVVIEADRMVDALGEEREDSDALVA